MTQPLPTGAFDLIRALVTGLTVALNANPKKDAELAAANQQIMSLQSQLADFSAKVTAKLAADDAQLKALGTPLSADEVNHLGDVLGAVANNDTPSVPAPPTPPVAAPAPAPAPAADTQPAPAQTKEVF